MPRISGIVRRVAWTNNSFKHLCFFRFCFKELWFIYGLTTLPPTPWEPFRLQTGWLLLQKKCPTKRLPNLKFQVWNCKLEMSSLKFQAVNFKVGFSSLTSQAWSFKLEISSLKCQGSLLFGNLFCWQYVLLAILFWVRGCSYTLDRSRSRRVYHYYIDHLLILLLLFVFDFVFSLYIAHLRCVFFSFALSFLFCFTFLWCFLFICFV